MFDAEAARHLQNLIFAFGVVATGCFTAIVTTLIRYHGRRALGTDIAGRLDAMADQMARLDNAVDAIAVEVERVSEGQRFVTKVLAERDAVPALPEAIRGSGSTPRH